MSYKANWLIKNEVVLITYSGDQTVEDLRASLIESGTLIKSSSRTSVHIISDITRVTYSLKIQDTMKVVRELTGNTPNVGWRITVGKVDVVTKMGIAVSKSILRAKIISVGRIDEAITHLKKVDPDLNWIQANKEILS